jgi:CubicO group peptidase (beta-lactamase class C family)
MSDASVPGASVALIGDGSIVWRRAFGVRDRDSRVPVDVDTVFEAASTSKPVFAYAVMKLRERGVIDLDTPLTTYTTTRFVPGDPRLDRLTARHVLTHTTGLPNWRSDGEPLQFAFTPGERWGYSGEGFHYLQSVVTRLTGSRTSPSDCGRFELDYEACAEEPGIEAYMQGNILRPFGMTSSGYFWSPAMEAHVARGHDEHGVPSTMDRKPSAPAVARYGMAGGLCTTPTDYARFLIEVVDPKPPDDYRLTRESHSEMLRPQVRHSPTSSWALGWQVEHTASGDVIRHGGGNPGYSCFVAGFPARKTGYVIMTNGEGSGFFGVIAKLISGDVLGEFLGTRLSDRSG